MRFFFWAALDMLELEREGEPGGLGGETPKDTLPPEPSAADLSALFTRVIFISALVICFFYRIGGGATGGVWLLRMCGSRLLKGFRVCFSGRVLGEMVEKRQNSSCKGCCESLFFYLYWVVAISGGLAHRKPSQVG